MDRMTPVELIVGVMGMAEIFIEVETKLVEMNDTVEMTVNKIKGEIASQTTLTRNLNAITKRRTPKNLEVV